MPPLHFLVKPVSGSCNLRCRYCFYRDVEEKREGVSCGRMSEETLEILIRRAMEETEGSCTFGFQGGEPTLAGLGFFRRAVTLQQKYNRRGLPVYNAIQTNGLVLDREWADFLAENRFLVGLSLDGPKEIHDQNRVGPAGEGTYSRVLQAAQLLKSRNVEFNILAVVTRASARHPESLYSFFRRSGLPWLQFIPCLDPLEEQRGKLAYSLTPQDYGEFLKRIFDYWYRDVKAGRFIYIRYFENLVGMLAGLPPESCGMSGRCGIQNVVEADGSVYPCDFYALYRWRMGNIHEIGVGEMMDSLAARAFLKAGEGAAEKCLGCRFYPICRGGCRRDREVPGGEIGLNYLCPAFEMFFEYALPRLREVAAYAAH